MKNAARQETELTRMPPTSGPRMDVAAEEPAQMPNARPCSSPSKLAVMMDNEAGTTSAPAAPWRMRNRISCSMFGARPHRSEVTPKPTRPIAYIRRRP